MNDYPAYDYPSGSAAGRLATRLEWAETKVEDLQDRLYAAERAIDALIRQHIATDDWDDDDIEHHRNKLMKECMP